MQLRGGGDATCWHSKNRSSYWSCMFSATATNIWRCCCPTGLLFTALSQNPQHDGLYSQIYYCFSSILFLLSITAFYWAFCSFNFFFFFFFMWFLLRYLLYFMALFCCIEHSIVYYFCCCNRGIHQSVNQIKCSHPSATPVTFKCLYHCSAFNLQYKAPWGNGCYDLLLYK